jgi:hypothetical protein
MKTTLVLIVPPPEAVRRLKLKNATELAELIVSKDFPSPDRFVGWEAGDFDRYLYIYSKKRSK